MSKTTLTIVEKHAVQNMLREGLEVEDIAKALKKSAAQVNKYVDSLVAAVEQLEANKVEVAEETKQAVNNHRAKDMMINQTLGKKNNSVMIMTREASEYSDDAKKIAPTRSRTSKGSIFNIKENRIE